MIDMQISFPFSPMTRSGISKSVFPTAVLKSMLSSPSFRRSPSTLKESSPRQITVPPSFQPGTSFPARGEAIPVRWNFSPLFADFLFFVRALHPTPLRRIRFRIRHQGLSPTSPSLLPAPFGKEIFLSLVRLGKFPEKTPKFDQVMSLYFFFLQGAGLPCDFPIMTLPKETASRVLPLCFPREEKPGSSGAAEAFPPSAVSLVRSPSPSFVL